MNVHQTFTSEQRYCHSQNVLPCQPLTANSITCQHRTKSWGASPTLISHHAGNWQHCPAGAQTLAKCSLKSPIDRILSVVLLGDEPGWSVAEAVPTGDNSGPNRCKCLTDRNGSESVSRTGSHTPGQRMNRSSSLVPPLATKWSQHCENITRRVRLTFGSD